MSKGAIGEMTDLLRLPDGVSPGMDTGYIDVLGDHDPIGPHRGQQIFRRKALPLVYEHFWRPAVARFFVGLSGPRAATERQITTDMLEISPGDRVIDVGCGPGNYTRYLAEAAGDGLVVGLDASEAMVAAAAKKGGGANLAYLRGDACSLPFDDGVFDAACSVGVIHMIEEPMAALEEMVRVLAPGGRLAILASCARKGRPRRVRGGVTIFARDELSGALRDHGLGDIDQRVVRRGQFLSARRPVEA